MAETSTTTKARIQQANTTTGEYDVREPLPYPFYINADGTIDRQDVWKGQPLRLAGFQRDAHVQHVDVLAETWLAELALSEAQGTKPNLDVVGMFPVFIDKGGSMWNSTLPIETAEVVR